MFRTTSARRVILGLAVAVALTASIAACGEEPATTPGAPVPAPSRSVDIALAAKVPAAIKTAGKIIIGTDSSYAPNEYLDSDGETVIGFDVDLFNAVAGRLGLATDWQSAELAAIIPGVGSGRYHIGVSSFRITQERVRQTTMVSYYSDGTRWAAKVGVPISPDDACGKKVAVQTGTAQVDDVTARSKKCTDAGQATITVDQYQSQRDATDAVVSGKDDAMLAASPVCAYAVRRSNGQLVLAGAVYDSARYGYVLPKDQADFGDTIRQALAGLIADGTYQTILVKWGVEAGAIADPAVNPQVS